ncbi:MAG: SIS domain-containing protein [Bacillota bacterium]|nr:SIS domain-containing protein [Bacillota bacterium]
MDKYSNLSDTAMLDYIHETPEALKRILADRKKITKQFVKEFINREIEELQIIGSGTSFHGGYAAHGLLERILKIPVCASYPMPFKDSKTVIDNKTMVIGISQGGESLSTVAGIDYAKSKGCFTVAITANDDGKRVSEHADMTVLLSCGPEYAGPKTKGYQATILILLLLGLETGLAQGKITEDYYNEILGRMETTFNNQKRVIEASEDWYRANRDEFMKCRRFVLVGYEANYGNVLEGRLKIQEAVRYGVEGYELEEFMHGIYHSIDENVFMLLLAPKGQYKDRIVKLKEFFKDYTEHRFLIGDFDGNADTKTLNVKFVDDPDFSIFEYILPLQCIAYYLSKDLGINPNIPKIVNFHYLMGSK